MKSNAIKLYKHFCELEKNPVGTNTDERAVVRFKAIQNKKKLEEHFKNSKKYSNDPEVQALMSNKPEVEDGKKSKR